MSAAPIPVPAPESAADEPLDPSVPRARPRAPEARRWIAPALLGAWLAVRWLVLRRVGLFNDEAYYWEWSRHLAASYYDHPPAVAYLIAASVRLLGRTPWAVHLPAFALALLTSAVLYLLARDLFPRRPAVGWWAVVALNAAPLFAVGALFTTPDAPSTFLWVLGWWLVWRATHGAPRAWYLAGIAVGAGLLSKYTAALLPLGVAVYLCGARHRHWWRRREPWIAAGIAVAMAVPVLLWNAEHGWASVAFQLVERHRGPWRPFATLRRFLVAQQGLSPLLWLLCVAALVRSVVLARRGSDAHAFLTAGSATVLGLFAAFAIHTWVNANWTEVAYLALLVSAGDLVDGRRWPVRVLPVAVAAAITGAAYVQATWMPFPSTGTHDLAADLRGWKQVGDRIGSLRAGMPDPAHTFVYATRFQVAALAAFHVGDGVEVTRLGAGRDAYDDWRDVARLRGRDAILVGDDWEPPALDPRFRRCERVDDLPVAVRGHLVRTFRFWRCWSFRP